MPHHPLLDIRAALWCLTAYEGAWVPAMSNGLGNNLRTIRAVLSSTVVIHCNRPQSSSFSLKGLSGSDRRGSS